MPRRPTKNPKENSSNIVETPDKDTYIKSLESQLSKLGEIANKLKTMVEQKETEIIFLKSMLEKTEPLINNAGPLFITDEEIIAVQQMERLKNISSNRPMTLEEIKAFDLLVKNKKLTQKYPTLIPYTPTKTLKDTELLEIAETSILTDNENYQND